MMVGPIGEQQTKENNMAAKKKTTARKAQNGKSVTRTTKKKRMAKTQVDADGMMLLRVGVISRIEGYVTVKVPREEAVVLLEYNNNPNPMSELSDRAEQIMRDAPVIEDERRGDVYLINSVEALPVPFLVPPREEGPGTFSRKLECEAISNGVLVENEHGEKVFADTIDDLVETLGEYLDGVVREAMADEWDGRSEITITVKCGD